MFDRPTPHAALSSEALASPGVSHVAPARASGVAAALQYLTVATPLALLLLTAALWAEKAASFRALLLWTGAGFGLHYWLPRRLQRPFFVVLSIGAAGWVLGLRTSGWAAEAALPQLAALLALGCGLVALCHLDVAPRTRFGLLLLAGLTLALLRSSKVTAAALPALWPMLGSMFMFRLVLYATDTARQPLGSAKSGSLAYFFMFPNVFCPLYPVVDWQTFERSHFNDEPQRIYRKGLLWMGRGLTQLLCYRAIHEHLYIPPSQVTDGASLAWFLVTNYALYLRVSGLFHWLMGTLHLFGWNLPETNHQYFLADSFTDYWRRVNIYWKEFVLKTFFNPVAFRMRRAGTVWAVRVGSAIAFFATWALHAYQVFWLTGATSLSIPDALFWGTLGVLVLHDASREARRGALKRLTTRFSWRRSLGAALGTVRVFGALCVLWSLWSADGLRSWLRLWRHANVQFALAAVLVLLAVAAVKVAVERAEASRRPVPLPAGAAPTAPTAPLEGVLTFATLVLTLVVSTRADWVRHVAPDSVVQALARTARGGAPGRPSQGYYEALMDGTDTYQRFERPAAPGPSL